VFLMLVGGVWSAAANLALFIWARRQGLPMSECMTLVFVTLCFIEFAKAFAFRSDRHTMFRRLLANHWLNLAVVWEISLLAAVLYVPFLNKAFGVFALPTHLWFVVAAVALTIIPALELAKWVVRLGWVCDRTR
jgi:Ca2+-transporting ATPase